LGFQGKTEKETSKRLPESKGNRDGTKQVRERRVGVAPAKGGLFGARSFRRQGYGGT